MKQFYALTMKNKKVTLITLSLVIIFLLSSLVTYKTFVRQYLFNDYVVYQSRELSNENIPLENVLIEQPIQIVSNSMTGLGLRFKDVDPNSKNQFSVVVKNDSGENIYTENIPENKIHNDQIYYLRFNASQLKVGSIYSITVKSLGATRASLITVNPRENEYGIVRNCMINQERSKQSIAYSVIDGNCFHLRNFYWLIVLLILILIAMTYLMYIYNVKLYKASFVIIVLIGIIYALIVPQFSVPDEYTHYLTSYSQSSILLGKKAFDEHGNVLLYEDSSNTLIRASHPTVNEYVKEYDGLIGKDKFKINRPYISRAPLTLGSFGYFPQVLGVSLGRILGFNGIQIGILGRISGLLLFGILISYSLKIIPKFFEKVLFTISILPMTLQQVCSYNYDSVLFTASFFLLAYLLYLVYEKEKINKLDIALVTLSSIIIATIKFVYLPILGLGLLIPREKFTLKHGKILVILMLVVLSLGSYLVVMKCNSLFWNVHESNTSSLIDYNTYTVSQVIQHPLREIVIIIATFQRFTADYISQMISGPLGWLEMNVPALQLSGFLMMLFYSLFSIEKKSKMDRNVKICSGLFSMLMILIVILALQISWTPDNSLIVVGVQGRYFLPILPMILLAMKDLLTVKAKNTNIILFYGNIILHISEIFTILCIVIGR